ncbi:hypothetical protein Vadar_033763 [Vaccinium darrowii]|uniref:Uncharacterized protein n=1 Tax=Vaccinium darrowii TaxID=229202 RepID=A0ACB7XWQ2_9ERIC|nr:hypothetical protein Vadar_033763 [Vaccinium darrowii]
MSFVGSSQRDLRVFAVASTANEAWNYIPAAPIYLPEGPWKQVVTLWIPGGVTAANGFKAAGMYGRLRAKGEKPDLALVTCEVDAISAGAFTTNVVAAAPVVYCKKALDMSTMACAVLINAGQANAATDALLSSLPKLVNLTSSTIEGTDSAAVAITTTDLVSKSVAVEYEVGGTWIRIGGMAKGSGMIHPNMAKLFGVITTEALVTSNVWRKMVQMETLVQTMLSLHWQVGGSNLISSLDSSEAKQLQECLDAVMQGPAKSIAWDGEGATCLIEVTVTGAGSEAAAAKIARSGPLLRLPRLRCMVGIQIGDALLLQLAMQGFLSTQISSVSLGDILLMDGGQPLPFDRASASNYLRKAGEKHGTVEIQLCIGLSRLTTDEKLKEAFAPFGQLVEAKVVMDRVSGRSKGFAFVTYATLEEAEQARKKMNARFLDGWVIFVDPAKPGEERPPPEPETQSSETGFRVNKTIGWEAYRFARDLANSLNHMWYLIGIFTSAAAAVLMPLLLVGRN